MKHLYCHFALLLATLSSIALPMTPMAKEHKVLLQKADAAEKIANQTEQEQLEKARQAVKQREAREQALSNSQGSEWEAQQRQKAQQQFNERESREQKYLREAKEAAAQERKIPKP